MTALAVAVTGSPQRGGFFGGLRNIFRGGRGGGNAVRGGRAQGGGRCGSSAPNHRFVLHITNIARRIHNMENNM